MSGCSSTRRLSIGRCRVSYAVLSLSIEPFPEYLVTAGAADDLLRLSGLAPASQHERGQLRVLSHHALNALKRVLGAPIIRARFATLLRGGFSVGLPWRYQLARLMSMASHGFCLKSVPRGALLRHCLASLMVTPHYRVPLSS